MNICRDAFDGSAAKLWNILKTVLILRKNSKLIMVFLGIWKLWLYSVNYWISECCGKTDMSCFAIDALFGCIRWHLTMCLVIKCIVFPHEMELKRTSIRKRKVLLCHENYVSSNFCPCLQVCMRLFAGVWFREEYLTWELLLNFHLSIFVKANTIYC